MEESDAVEIIASDSLRSARQQREAKLAEFEARRVARAVVVPTDDSDVKAALRAHAEPICLYGEDAHDRRERLRQLLARDVIAKNSGQGDQAEKAAKEEGVPHDASADENRANKEGEQVKEEADEEERDKKDDDEEYFTEGTEDLRQLRFQIATRSLKRARVRLQQEAAYTGNSHTAVQLRTKRRDQEQHIVANIRAAEISASHIGDDRPLSAIAYSESEGDPRSNFVVTGSWGGTVKVWGGQMFGTVQQEINSHDGRVSMVRTYDNAVMLSCGTDGIGYMYTRSDALDYGKAEQFHERLKLDSHNGSRVSDIGRHPFHHSLVVTCAYDGVIALHDTDKVVLRQQSGQDKAYRATFHPDGSLLASCGLDGSVRLWDLRSGRAILTMTKAHSDDVLALQFHPNGFNLLSAGADNLVHVWDLRKVKCVKTIAAHSKLVSCMKLCGRENVLFTGSFDQTIKCWGSQRNWGLLNAHTGFEDKITAIDCSKDGDVVVAACYEKTWKLISSQV